MNYVIHHQCYKNKKAVENVLKTFRVTNPKDPYVLWSDNGDDFSELAAKYNANFIFSDYNIKFDCYKGREQLYNLFDRVRKTCQMYPDKKYVMWVEDDVLFKGKVNIPNDVDFCGWAENKPLSLRLRFGDDGFERICKKYKVTPNFDYWTIAGGAIMSSDVFLNKFDILEKYIDEDWVPFCESVEGPNCPWYQKSMYGDIEFMMAHLVCGKQYSIWNQITECHRNLNWKDEQYVVVHGYKEKY
jgi:hypothetical protein